MLSDNQNNNLVPRFSLQGTDERKRNTGNDVAKAAAHETGLSVVIQFDSELKLRRGSWFLAFLVNVFSQIFGPIVSIRVKTLSKTRLVASRYIKREKVSLPVDLLPGRGSKTPLPKLSVVLDQDPDFFNISPCSWLAKVLYLLIVTFGVCLIPNVVSNRLFRSGNFCPVCLKVYRNDESDLPMVCCDMCDRWVHTGKGVFTL